MGKKKSVLGLFVDGLDVKVAHLSIRGKRIVLHSLRSGTLAAKIEERKMAEVDAMAGGDGGADPFSLSGASSAEMGSTAGSEDNNSVLLGLLSQYQATKVQLAYSIAEPSLYYHLLESDFGLKGSKLKDRILAELRAIRSFQPAADAVDSIHTDEGNLLCVVREDGLSLINSLEDIKGFIGGRLPRIPVIDSADISLMNMVRLNYDLQPNEVTVVVYVGFDFTRLIFMRGKQFYQFAPILGEGYDSANIANTVYSRLLLEQDNLGIPRISRIILAGESRRINLSDFLSQQLPDQDVDYLIAPQLDASQLPSDQQEMISEYAVPLGVAWRTLAPEDPDIYSINLLPAAVQEGQRSLKLAWHGYLLLALLFISTFFFSMSITQKTQEITEQEGVLRLKQTQIAEVEALQASIIELEQQLVKFQTSLALYDSIVPGSDRWHRTFTQLSHGVEDLNSLWLADLGSDEKGVVTMSGYSIYRTRIPRLSTLFDSSILKEVTVQEIREVPLYKYIIEVPAPVTEQPGTNQ
jgi:hypothetical protein